MLALIINISVTVWQLLDLTIGDLAWILLTTIQHWNRIKNRKTVLCQCSKCEELALKIIIQNLGFWLRLNSNHWHWWGNCSKHEADSLLKTLYHSVSSFAVYRLQVLFKMFKTISSSELFRYVPNFSLRNEHSIYKM